jgi:hypothetical protein
MLAVSFCFSRLTRIPSPFYPRFMEGVLVEQASTHVDAVMEIKFMLRELALFPLFILCGMEPSGLIAPVQAQPVALPPLLSPHLLNG